MIMLIMIAGIIMKINDSSNVFLNVKTFPYFV